MKRVINRLTNQTAVARTRELLFLKGARMGSPRRRFAKIEPENITTIDENQQLKGCLRLND